MEKSQLKSLLETLIFVAEQPLKIQEMHQAIQAYEEQMLQTENAESDECKSAANDTEIGAVPEQAQGDVDTQIADLQTPSAQLASFAEREEKRIGKSDIAEALRELVQSYSETPERGIFLSEVANGWQFCTRPENATIVRQLFDIKPTRLSKPSLETLAIVAYRQPITRVEIDEIRGVDSGGVLKTLLERNLVRIVGKKDEAGRPMLYGTTHEFLELFQLKSLKDLPSLKEFRELEEEFRAREAAEGVIVENVQEPETLTQAIAEISSGSTLLEQLNAEEEEMIGELEGTLQELRQVEQEIFTEKNPDATNAE